LVALENTFALLYNRIKPLVTFPKEVFAMGKVIECAKVDPSSGCKHVIRGNTEEEVMKNAMEHAKSHGIREATPELKAKAKAAIRDEK
jgi:predicted small metal-binding protein